MRHLSLTFALTILWASSCWAMSPAFLAVVTSGGVATPSFCTGGELVCQQFNDTGAPPGWSVIGDAAVDFDASSNQFNGTQYLSIDYASGASYVQIPITDSSTVYFTALVRVRAFPTIASSSQLMFYNNTTYQAAIRLNTVGDVQAFSSVSSAYVSAFSIDSSVYVKYRYTKGTSSNTIVEVWTSPDRATWTKKVELIGGTQGTLDVNSIRIYVRDGSAWDYEDIKITTTDQ